MEKFKLVLPIVFAAACSPEPPSLPSNIRNASFGKAALDSQQKGSFSQLLELKAKNDALCLRVQKQRVECPVAAKSLRPEDDQAILGCVSGVDPNAKVDSNFEMDISIPSGTKAILTTKNGLWQTQPVASGSKQKLTWGPRAKSACDVLPPKNGTLVRSPRVIELTDMSLRIVSDNCSANTTYSTSNVSSFNLYLNGTSLFDRGDLSDGGGSIQVSLTKLLGFQQDPKCFVQKDELAQIMNEAKANMPATPASAAPADLEAQIARETNRNDQMIKQLTGSENLGCWGYQKIRKLQVKVDGAALPNSNLGLSGGALSNAGNSKEYTFSFGEAMNHVISDESQNAVFRAGGGFVIDSFASREVQELRGLRIRKGGVAYQNDPVYKPGFFGIGDWRGFQRYELNLRSLSKISIFANDQLVYEKSGISFTFQGDKLVWPSNNGSEQIQNSPAFIALMTRNDCPAE